MSDPVEISAGLSAKARVRKVLRTYMETPGATMETDVFMAMVKLIEEAEAKSYRQGIEAAARVAEDEMQKWVGLGAYSPVVPCKNIAAAIRQLLEGKE